MSSLHYRLKVLDARYPFPRPADRPQLDAYHAALRLGQDIGKGAICFACALVTAICVFILPISLFLSDDVSFYLRAFIPLLVMLCLTPVANLIIPYYRISQRLSSGSARWADGPTLMRMNLAKRKSEPTVPGQLYLGTLGRKYEVMLSITEAMRHLAVIGPSGSGKSKTFFMSIARDWAAAGNSAVFMDTKGELYGNTAEYFDNVYRLDLIDPELSDRWNLLTVLRGDAEQAHAVASQIVGLNSKESNNSSDPFWPQAETALLTALILHLTALYDNPSPAMISEYLSKRSFEAVELEMSLSPNPEVRINWGIFKKASLPTQGSVFVGLGVTLLPFRTPNTMTVLSTPTAAEAEAGVKSITLADLRKPRTAIYVVVPEGDADRYKVVLSTFFGLVANVLRRIPTNDVAVLFALDEAGNVPLQGLSEMTGVGRGRLFSILLGYQNISQGYAQYGHEGFDAILGSISTQIFLPGLDDKTTQYATRRIGKTTVLKHTSVDAPGKKFDNEREAEAARDLLDQTELRQMVPYTQAVCITGAAPPILLGYPMVATTDEPTQPYRRRLSLPLTLDDIEAMMPTIPVVSEPVEEQNQVSALATTASATSQKGDSGKKQKPGGRTALNQKRQDSLHEKTLKPDPRREAMAFLPTMNPDEQIHEETVIPFPKTHEHEIELEVSRTI